MSVSSTGASGGAYNYLRSLLPPPSADGRNAAGSSDPVTQLLQAFYPSGQNDQPGAATATVDIPAPPAGGATTSSTKCPGFNADTMASLISMQGGEWGGRSAVAAQAQSVFGEFDSNGDGQISKSEFEGVFGSNADTSKVDGLFNALDSNGDGSVSQDELTSAAEQSHAAHHHHHHLHGGISAAAPGSGSEGGLAALLSSTDLTGATTQTASNADGSSSTTITYADGSTVSMTTPATPSAATGSSTSSADGSSSDDTSIQSTSAASNYLLERLIRMQAQFLSQSSSQVIATA
jgi:hypothetical protein